nr:hypothetical protein [Tanacetum cinerariifolium]
MVAIDGAGFDWSYMADDEAPTNMAFMAFSDSELSGSTFLLSCLTKLTTTSNLFPSDHPYGFVLDLHAQVETYLVGWTEKHTQLHRSGHQCSLCQDLLYFSREQHECSTQKPVKDRVKRLCARSIEFLIHLL